jgi:hypothetical protein
VGFAQDGGLEQSCPNLKSTGTELRTRQANKDTGMSHSNGDPPRRVFDFDTLVDYAGLLVAVPLIVVITWLILGPTHIGLEPNTHPVYEVLAAAVLDAVIAVIVGVIILLRRHPPTSLIWNGLMLIILGSLCVSCCWVTVVLLDYWSQPK